MLFSAAPISSAFFRAAARGSLASRIGRPIDRLAESLSQYLSKGREVYVEGKLRTRQWEDQQGTKRYTTEIIAREIQLLGSSGQARQNESLVPGETGQGPRARSLTTKLPPSSGAPEDDIPF